MANRKKPRVTRGIAFHRFVARKITSRPDTEKLLERLIKLPLPPKEPRPYIEEGETKK